MEQIKGRNAYENLYIECYNLTVKDALNIYRDDLIDEGYEVVKECEEIEKRALTEVVLENKITDEDSLNEELYKLTTIADYINSEVGTDTILQYVLFRYRSWDEEDKYTKYSNAIEGLIDESLERISYDLDCHTGLDKITSIVNVLNAINFDSIGHKIIYDAFVKNLLDTNLLEIKVTDEDDITHVLIINYDSH